MAEYMTNCIERQIATTDKEEETLRQTQGDTECRIDQLVFELHGLTEGGVRVVEGEQE
jgi:hypothetical protein